MDFWTAFYLLGLLKAACCSPEASYSVNTDRLSFGEAQKRCSPGGFLANVPTKQDRDGILRAVWDRPEPGAFWIGLRKNKGSCVQHHLQLKGFVWTLDNSTRSEGNSWRSGPLETCTDPRCGLLWVDYSGSEPWILGFGDAGCKQKYPFICKRNMEAKCQMPFIHQLVTKTVHKEDPFKLEVQCQSGALFTLRCSSSLKWTLEDNQEADTSQLCLECNAGFRRDTSGNCVDVDECEESRPCRHRCLNSEGSYRCHCGPDCEEPPSTPDPGRREDDSRNASFGGGGSTTADYESANKTAVHIEEFNADISHIVVPVIIALLVLVVLLVVIAAIVKACLRRRSIKRARRKAETVALNGSSSVEKVNEKEET